jgi:hypothetical protein
MSIDKLIHLHFLSLHVFVLIIFDIAIYIKLKNKKAPKKLSEEKYKSTLIGKMVDTTKEKSMFNIWPFVNELKSGRILSKKNDENQLIHKIYRDSNNNFEHILLSTEKENHFVVIVVNLTKNKIKGYFLVDTLKNYS